MPVQRVSYKKLREVPFSANSQKEESLDRGLIYRELYLELSATPTIAGAANVAANIKKGGLWGVIKRLDIVANGSQIIKSFSGTELWWLNYFWYGVAPQVEPGLLDTGTANPVLKSHLIIPFWMPRLRKPFDTAFNTRTLSDLKIVVQWGTYTDINSAASAWTTEPILKVSNLDSHGIDITNTLWKNIRINQIITASNSNHQIQLPVGDVYRSFYINTTDNGNDDGTILNNIKLKSGNTVMVDITGKMLQEITRLRQSVKREFSGSAYTKLMPGNANSYAGHYYLDLVTDGSLTEAIDTLGLNQLNLELDVTKSSNTTELIIVPQMLVPVRGNVAKAG